MQASQLTEQLTVISKWLGVAGWVAGWLQSGFALHIVYLCDRKLWLSPLTFEFDPDRVEMNQYAKNIYMKFNNQNWSWFTGTGIALT